jgi:microcystin-dependent protein
MALQFPITFSCAPIPTGQSLDANQYAQILVSNLQAYISGQFLTGQIGGSAPTTDIGPWFNNGVWYYWDPGSQQYIPQSLTSSFPTGSIIDFGGIVAPTGFVLCDGSLYLRTGAMAGLFSVIGTSYGAGDGSSTFAVPDARGRVGLGTGAGSGLTARTIGQKLGEENHVLAVSELASHNHTQNAHAHADAGHLHSDSGHFHSDNGHAHGITDPGHVHGYVNAVLSAPGSSLAGGSTFQSGSAATNPSGTGIGINTGFAAIAEGHAAIAAGFAAIENATATNNAAGGGAGHNNIQPSLVMTKIIKT